MGAVIVGLRALIIRVGAVIIRVGAVNFRMRVEALIIILRSVISGWEQCLYECEQVLSD